ncbi:MAG: branched-chain amino acid ABC transporter permease [Candidatus Bathyarchaeia archaeon]
MEARKPFDRRKLLVSLFMTVLVALIVLPYVTTAYMIAFLFIVFVHLTLAQGWDIVGGYTGYLNLGYSSFFGVGAYVFATSILYGIHYVPSLLLAGIVTVAFAGVLSLPLFRLRGAYFALATFGIVLLLGLVTRNLAILGGSIGQPVPIFPGYLTYSYYGALCLALAVTLTKYKIVNSKLGLALRSIHEDEEAAEGLGVKTFKCKALMFMVSALFAALMGGVYMIYTAFIDPSIVFGLEITLTPVVMAMLGGSGTIIGPLVGVTLIMLVEELIWTMTPYLHLAMYGAIFVIVGLFIPGGIISLKYFQILRSKLGF